MAAKIDVVGNLQEALYLLKDKPEYSSVVRYAEMLIRKMEATEQALRGRLASDKLDLFQRTLISLAPSCVDSSNYRDPRISVGRIVDLAQHITYEAFRAVEPQVRNSIDARLKI